VATGPAPGRTSAQRARCRQGPDAVRVGLHSGDPKFLEYLDARGAEGPVNGENERRVRFCVAKPILAYGAQPSSATASSISFEETVHPSLTFKVTAPGRARLVFSGRLAITPLGAPRPLVLIEVRAADGWETVGSPVRVNSAGRYLYDYKSSAITIGRRFIFRAASPATSAWQTATSATRKAVVH
jgi:hypothetical protein